MHEKELCPRCKVAIDEVEFDGGPVDDVVFTTTIWYCPKCLYRFDSLIEIYRRSNGHPTK